MIWSDEYVSYDTAKLLKEKGFDGFCMCFYRKDDNNLHNVFLQATLADGDDIYSAPTYQTAMKWLREKHNIHIGIVPFDCMTIASGYIVRYNTSVSTLRQDYLIHKDLGIHLYYEDACEDAIKYCLKNIV